MANRKQELDAAVALSRQEAAEKEQMSNPAPSGGTSPGFELPYTKKEKAAAAAPMHPRAIKGQQVRQRELAAAAEAAGQGQQKLEEAGKEKIAKGQGIVKHVKKSAPGFGSISKKFGSRQVKKGKRGVIESGDVTLTTDYEGGITRTTRSEALTANDARKLREQKQKKEVKKKKRTSPISSGKTLPSGRRVK